MKINIGFNEFKKNHSKKKHQILFKSRNCKEYYKIENLFKFLLAEKNSFIFESVEKGKIKGRYTVIGLNPDKIWDINKNTVTINSLGKKTKINLCKYAISSSEIKKLSDLNVVNNCNIVSMGSIAYKIALVAKGKFDIAISFTKKNDWDLAAADIILQEAGGMTNQIIGGKIKYNTPDLKIKSVIASNTLLIPIIKKLLFKKIN